LAFKWLSHLMKQTSGKDESSTDLISAVAVLMLEVAESDFQETEEETNTVLAGLYTHMGDDSRTPEQLLADARSEKSNSAGLYAFTRLACTKMSLSARCMLIEQLWDIAFADGVIDKYEEAAIRKVSELLYVPHSDFIKAKLAAKKVADATG